MTAFSILDLVSIAQEPTRAARSTVRATLPRTPKDGATDAFGSLNISTWQASRARRPHSALKGKSTAHEKPRCFLIHRAGSLIYRMPRH